MSKRKMSQLKQSERDARRRLILDSACSLFSEKDFRKVNVREIAAEAGASVGTIYNYYSDLDELFLDVFLKNAEEISRLLEAENRNGGLTLDKLCETYIDYLNRNMTFYQMMGHFMLGGKLSQDATSKLNQMMRLLMDSIEATLKGQGVHGDSRSLAHALFSALNGIMISYSGYPGRDPEKVNLYTKKLGHIVADVFKARLNG